MSSGNGNLWCIDLKLAVERGAKATDRDVSSELLVRMVKQPDGTTKAETKPNPASALVWHFGGQEQRKWARRDFKFDRTLSTVAIADDILYATGIGGFVYCLNAKTGELYWEYDTRASIWGSPYLVDGKLIVVTDAGELFFLQHKAKPGKYDFTELAKNAPNQRDARKIYRAEAAKFEKDNLLAKIELPQCVQGTPTVVNGVLYLATESSTLFAIRSRK